MKNFLRLITVILALVSFNKNTFSCDAIKNVTIGEDFSKYSEILDLINVYNPEDYDEGRNFGHLAYAVDDIYETCQRLMDNGVTINRPPRDGRMAFVRSPDNISIELLQNGDALPAKEPWASMENTGKW